MKIDNQNYEARLCRTYFFIVEANLTTEVTLDQICEEAKISKEEVENKLNFQDVLNPANGSAGKMIDYLKLWGTLSDEIKVKLNYPLKDNFEILNISKLISESLEIHHQINLINLIQQIWWTKTKNPNLIKSLENLKLHLKNKIQPRLAWEVTLLKISSENI